VSASSTSDAVASPTDELLGQNHDFGIVLVSQGISAFGDAVNSLALTLLVFALSGSGFVMGVVAALTALADFAFALPAGSFADRHDRKRMLIGADLGRAILTGLIPLTVLLGGPALGVVILVAAPLAILRAVFRAAFVAATPALVGRSNLARATAILEVVISAAYIVGPAIAGILATAIGPGPTLAIDALSYVVSVVGLQLVSRPLRPPVGRPPSRIIDDIREGLRYVARDPVLRPLVSIVALATAIYGPVVTVLTFRVVDDLGQPESIVGVALTVFGVGAMVGSLLATRFHRLAGSGVAALASVAAMGISLIAIAMLDAIPALVVATAAVGASETWLGVALVSLRTAASPDALLGRIASVSRVASLGLQPIGALVIGLVVDATSGTTATVVMGIALCVVALAFLPARALRSASVARLATGAVPDQEVVLGT
jgi:predicted MFS family arabinose efflux permease